ncbi:uncharacterized protein [Patagioenas fasciata]|uniref:uncharacterized protein n=1 Tax=Patagioenas fasciata TaxID=372321 RepID=UPI003A9973BA
MDAASPVLLVPLSPAEVQLFSGGGLDFNKAGGECQSPGVLQMCSALSVLSRRRRSWALPLPQDVAGSQNQRTAGLRAARPLSLWERGPSSAGGAQHGGAPAERGAERRPERAGVRHGWLSEYLELGHSQLLTNRLWILDSVMSLLRGGFLGQLRLWQMFVDTHGPTGAARAVWGTEVPGSCWLHRIKEGKPGCPRLSSGQERRPHPSPSPALRGEQLGEGQGDGAASKPSCCPSFLMSSRVGTCSSSSSSDSEDSGGGNREKWAGEGLHGPLRCAGVTRESRHVLEGWWLHKELSCQALALPAQHPRLSCNAAVTHPQLPGLPRKVWSHAVLDAAPASFKRGGKLQKLSGSSKSIQ